MAEEPDRKFINDARSDERADGFWPKMVESSWAGFFVGLVAGVSLGAITLMVDFGGIFVVWTGCLSLMG